MAGFGSEGVHTPAPMIDYYTALLRAVTTPGAANAQWRHAVYDRARQLLVERMHARRPSPPLAEIVNEQAALEAAIERIETELAAAEGVAGRDGAVAAGDAGIAEQSWPETERGPIAKPPPAGAAVLIALALFAAALGAGVYTYWRAPVPLPTPVVTATKDKELAPGVDGGSSDPDLPYVFRRQPTFYRTPLPVGTIIVDRLQHFLYLTQPNNVALRYGVAVGEECSGLAGLRHVARMTEWPQWRAPPDMVRRKLASADVMPGRPGNPLGARLLELDDGTSRIHGTNAPKTIGNAVVFGCIRLVNDDIVDLYDRVRVTTPVVIN